MDSMFKVAIVIPCYNEEKRLPCQTLLSYLDIIDYVDFIFINDGSFDRTEEILEKIYIQAPNRCFLINIEKNQGKAEAVRQGFLYAIKNNYSLIGFWDADLATSLNEIERFIAILTKDKIEIVMGSRVSMLGTCIARSSLRHYMGRLFATTVSSILKINSYDTQCGAKIFKNSEYLRKVFSIPFVTSWSFDVEILARYILLLKQKKQTNFSEIALELPLKEWKDISGSKVKCSSFLFEIFNMIKIYLILNGFDKKIYGREL